MFKPLVSKCQNFGRRMRGGQTHSDRPILLHPYHLRWSSGFSTMSKVLQSFLGLPLAILIILLKLEQSRIPIKLQIVATKHFLDFTFQPDCQIMLYSWLTFPYSSLSLAVDRSLCKLLPFPPSSPTKYWASPSISRNSAPSPVCLILSLVSCMDRSLVCRNRKKVVERDNKAINSLHLQENCMIIEYVCDCNIKHEKPFICCFPEFCFDKFLWCGLAPTCGLVVQDVCLSKKNGQCCKSLYDGADYVWWHQWISGKFRSIFWCGSC